jgi:hypothetical protein
MLVAQSRVSDAVFGPAPPGGGPQRALSVGLFRASLGPALDTAFGIEWEVPEGISALIAALHAGPLGSDVAPQVFREADSPARSIATRRLGRPEPTAILKAA